jgi:hypothetical protein
MAAAGGIGRGLQGVVRENTPGVVKKVTSASVGEREERAAKILATVDPDQRYTVYGTDFTLSANGKQLTITMPFGGIALEKFLDATYSLQYSKKPENKIYARKVYNEFIPHLPKIYESIDALIEWLPTMHAAGVTHSDSAGTNMLWDGEKVRLIDWGRSHFKEYAAFESEHSADIEGIKEIKELLQSEQAKVDALPAEGGRRRTYRIRKQKKKSKHTRRR